MSIPEPMLSTRAAAWPAHGDWVMQPKWDGFRLNPRLLRLMRSAVRRTQAVVTRWPNSGTSWVVLCRYRRKSARTPLNAGVPSRAKPELSSAGDLRATIKSD